MAVLTEGRATALRRTVEDIDTLRDEYDLASKHAKYKYLRAIADAKAEFGTTNVAKAMGITRHRVYQILNEADALGKELGLIS